MSRNKYFDIIFLFLCYITALAVDIMIFQDRASIDNLVLQTYILLGGCLLIGFSQLIIKNPILKTSFLLINSILLLVNGGLQGKSIAVELLTFTALTYLIVYSYRVEINIPCTLLFLAASAVTQSDLLILGEQVEGPSFSDNLFLHLTLILSLLLFNKLKQMKKDMYHLNTDLNAREKTISHLTDANRDFQKFAIDVEEESRIDERKIITRDLHDITGYTLTGVAMMIEHAQDLLSVENYQELNSLLDNAKKQTRKGHEDIRHSLKKLRAMDDYKNFYAGILQIIGNFKSATGVSVDVDFTNMTLTISKFGQIVIYRFIQEGLTNAFRHGKADTVSIMFFQEKENLVISLEDNGKGADTIQEGIGLQGMNERIGNLDGIVSYSSTSLGFTLRARIPLDRLRMIET